MKTFKRVLAVLMTAIIAVTVMVAPASAASLEELSTPIKSDNKVTFSTLSYTTKYYKINSSQKGELQINYNIKAYAVQVCVFNSLGERLGIAEKKAEIGTIKNFYSDAYTNVEWNANVEQAKGTLKYNINSGSYYISIKTNGECEGEFVADFPSNDTPATKSIQLKITLNVGDTLRLGAIIAPEDAEAVTYSSSKKSVATVSKTGKVKAISKGSTIIKLKSGQKALKIKIVVV